MRCWDSEADLLDGHSTFTASTVLLSECFFPNFFRHLPSTYILFYNPMTCNEFLRSFVEIDNSFLFCIGFISVRVYYRDVCLKGL